MADKGTRNGLDTLASVALVAAVIFGLLVVAITASWRWFEDPWTDVVSLDVLLGAFFVASMVSWRNTVRMSRDFKLEMAEKERRETH